MDNEPQANLCTSGIDHRERKFTRAAEVDRAVVEWGTRRIAEDELRQLSMNGLQAHAAMTHGGRLNTGPTSQAIDGGAAD